MTSKFSLRILIAVVLSISASAIVQAQTPPSPGLKFEDHKQKELARIAHHLQVLQTLQACVQSAANHAAIKACNETAHASMKNNENN